MSSFSIKIAMMDFTDNRPAAIAADPEAQLRAIWEPCSAGTDKSHNADHARHYAQEAARLSLAFLDKDGQDLGTTGWQLGADYAGRAKPK